MLRPILSDAFVALAPEVNDTCLAWMTRAVIALCAEEDSPELAPCPTELSLAWRAIERQQLALVKAYTEKCARNAEAGRMGGLAKSSNRKRMLANASECQQTQANESECLAKGKEKEEKKNETEIPKGDSSDSGLDVYSSIFDPSRRPEIVAISVTGELNSALARNAYAKQARRLGDRTFRNEVARLAGEMKAGEIKVQNPARLLMSRLMALKTA